MKKTIKLRYVDCMSGPNYKSEYLWRLLNEKYDIDEVSYPDYIISGGMGTDFTKYNDSIIIQLIGENICPDFNVFDYAIGFDHLTFGDRYLRVPLYVLYDEYQYLLKGTGPMSREDAINRKFCSFVVSNNRFADPIREYFFHALSKYKRVDSAGRYLNNMGGTFLEDKQKFISQYKFNIAFENSSSDGYTTEKVMQPLAAGTIPIYWGNPSIEKDFNKDAIICVSDFPSIEDCIKYIKYLDENDQAYYEKLSQPCFEIDVHNNYENKLLAFFDNIFSMPVQKAHRINKYGNQSVLNQRLLSFYGSKDKINNSFLIRIKRKIRSACSRLLKITYK